MIKFKKRELVRVNKKFKHDCVIRAVATVVGKKYSVVFQELMDLGKELGGYPNCDFVWQPYIESLGLVKNKMPRPLNNPRGTIKIRNWEFEGRAVVRNSSHLTAVVDGYCIDTWDCTYRPVNSYWTLD
tara:strand:+ start:441 stop:824 length:384 start_codon:yes stop_codon:yes gene_type:complete